MVLGFLLASPLGAQDFGNTSARSTIHFELLSDFLVVVNGDLGNLHGLKFIVDTGASYTLIDQKVADRLKLQRHPGKITNFDPRRPR